MDRVRVHNSLRDSLSTPHLPCPRPISLACTHQSLRPWLRKWTRQKIEDVAASFPHRANLMRAHLRITDAPPPSWKRTLFNAPKKLTSLSSEDVATLTSEDVTRAIAGVDLKRFHFYSKTECPPGRELLLPRCRILYKEKVWGSPRTS